MDNQVRARNVMVRTWHQVDDEDVDRRVDVGLDMNGSLPGANHHDDSRGVLVLLRFLLLLTDDRLTGH